jgi:hypothetical protein
MFDDNERPYNASSFLAVVHLDADIRSTEIVGASDPAYNGSNLTERIAARSLFVAKHTPYVVFGQFPILMFVKIKSSHPSQFPRRWIIPIARSAVSSCDCEPRICDLRPIWGSSCRWALSGQLVYCWHF